MSNPKYSDTPYYKSPEYSTIIKLENALQIEDEAQLREEIKKCIAEFKEHDKRQNTYYYDHNNAPLKTRLLLYSKIANEMNGNNTNVKTDSV
jgi:hypothetical protein